MRISEDSKEIDSSVSRGQRKREQGFIGLTLCMTSLNIAENKAKQGNKQTKRAVINPRQSVSQSDPSLSIPSLPFPHTQAKEPTQHPPL